MRKQRNERGFTLVELLIVVVILGVLAAMVMPRMLRQARAADTAEAIQMLGTIRRQVVGRIDAGNAVPNFNTGTGMASTDPWGLLGMGVLPGTRKYNYSHAAATGPEGSAVATPIAAAEVANTLTIDYQGGTFTCGGTLLTVTDAGGNVVGCRAA